MEARPAPPGGQRGQNHQLLGLETWEASEESQKLAMSPPPAGPEGAKLPPSGTLEAWEASEESQKVAISLPLTPGGGQGEPPKTPRMVRLMERCVLWSKKYSNIMLAILDHVF